MRYFKSISDNYIIGVGTGNICTEISEAEYHRITEIFRNKPSADSGYDYRLRADSLEWELVEVPIVDEPNTYTAEQLEAMTSTELKAICIELGIPTSMVKQNMIDLILGKQNEI